MSSDSSKLFLKYKWFGSPPNRTSKYCLVTGFLLSFVCVLPHLSSCDKRSSEKKEMKYKVSGVAGIEWIYSKPASIYFTKSEITVAQYKACVATGMCTEPEPMSSLRDCNWGYLDRDDHPVNCVDWYQASVFCDWAGGRLPTRDEWFSEATNGNQRSHPWIGVWPDCDRVVMNDKLHDAQRKSPGCGFDSTWPVCSRPRGHSVSGLCDMLGNVSEWELEVRISPPASLESMKTRVELDWGGIHPPKWAMPRGEVSGGSWKSGSDRLKIISHAGHPSEVTGWCSTIGARCVSAFPSKQSNVPRMGNGIAECSEYLEFIDKCLDKMHDVPAIEKYKKNRKPWTNILASEDSQAQLAKACKLALEKVKRIDFCR